MLLPLQASKTTHFILQKQGMKKLTSNLIVVHQPILKCQVYCLKKIASQSRVHDQILPRFQKMFASVSFKTKKIAPKILRRSRSDNQASTMKSAVFCKNLPPSSVPLTPMKKMCTERLRKIKVQFA